MPAELVSPSSTTQLAKLKVSLLTEGVRLTPEVEHRLSDGGRLPLTLHEYATTGGVTLVIGEDVYVNAPFDEKWSASAPSALGLGQDGAIVVHYDGQEYPAKVLPLPGYLDAHDQEGRRAIDVAMSHADRVRLSPLDGCAFSCKFCDLAATRYQKATPDRLVNALQIALKDDALPARHVLISGGTPGPKDAGYLLKVAKHVTAATRLPVDIMMAPLEDAGFVDELVDGGIHGFALNMEIFDPTYARDIVPQKARLGHAKFADAIERAVDRTGGRGRVRSLLVAGLEPAEATLRGVEFLARLGCDPVLSPFRPTRGTPLADARAPTRVEMEKLLGNATTICKDYGVMLGPRCIPCQHNTLSLPWGSGYSYS